jgi:hypothetical protein
MSDESTGQPAAPPPTPPPAPAAAPPAPPYMLAQGYGPRPPKSPGLATYLSFLLPGIGQVYNGQLAKAFAFFFGFVTTIYLVAEVDPMPFAFLIPFVYLFNLVDAWRSASLINARAAGGGAVVEEDTVSSPAWGATLVVLGLVLLANNLGWLRIEAFARYWPVLLIALGGFFIYNALRQRDAAPGGGDDAARP